MSSGSRRCRITLLRGIIKIAAFSGNFWVYLTLEGKFNCFQIALRKAIQYCSTIWGTEATNCQWVWVWKGMGLFYKVLWFYVMWYQRSVVFQCSFWLFNSSEWIGWLKFLTVWNRRSWYELEKTLLFPPRILLFVIESCLELPEKMAFLFPKTSISNVQLHV